MTFPAINSVITDQFVSALCNTLVHSLWQGLLLAAVAGFIIVTTKKSSSALRYNLLITALLLFAVATVITFASQLKSATPVETTHFTNNAPERITTDASAYPVQVPVVSQSLVGMVSSYLTSHHNTIVLIWFLVICAKSIQLGVGLYGTYYIKRTNTFKVDEAWQEHIKNLCAVLGINKTISLFESGIAKVPMVIGHLNPVILMPIGLLTALSTQEVEAILVHELAHIKRRDYLVNLLQSLIEIVFFFNPAVLWISQLIKIERENCCDDLALTQSSNKVNYIRALVSCEEYQASIPAYAMGFAGNKNTLLDRVKRLANDTNHSLNLFEKTLLAVCLVISGLCLSAYAERDNIKHAVHTVVAAFHHHPKIDEAQKQELFRQTSLLKDANAQLDKAADLLNASTPQLQVAPDTINRLQNLQAINVPMEINMPMTIPIDIHLDPLTGSLGSLSDKFGPADTNRRGRKINVPININVVDSIRAEAGITNLITAYANPYSKQYADYVAYQADTSKYVKAKHANYQPRGTDKNNNYNTRPDIQKQKAQERAALSAILTDLEKDGLISNRNHILFKLTEREFILNGKKQNEEVFLKYKKRYVPEHPGEQWTWSHSYNNDNQPEN